jgi:uncharacterized LabA/DUF88 family protein
MLERSRRVILLIDYDNLQICAARDTPGRDLQLTPVVQLAQRYGSVILARAYAEWNLSTERLAVYKAGIEPAFAPVLRTESDRSGKSLADTVMVAEGMDMLWTLSPEVMVLATSDKDLIPLVRVAKQRGAHVVVLGSDFTAIPLREMADEHVTYKQLITDAAGRYTGDAARTPAALPEPGATSTGIRSRRTRGTRERDGREPRVASQPAQAAPAPSPAPASPPPAPSRTPAAEPSGAPALSEPVAPVGAPGEGDGQVGGRRRRRRGSRRRGERLGVSGDVGGPEGSSLGDIGGPEGTSLGDVAEASSGTVEQIDYAEPPEVPEDLPMGAAPAPADEPAEPPEALIADVPAPMAEPEPDSEAVVGDAAEVPGTADTGAEETPAEGEEAPAPKPRRTRTRRVASATPTRTRTRRST